MTETGTTPAIDPLRLDALAFVLLLIVLPVVSFGATRGIDTLWMGGLVVLVIGALLPLITEFGLREDDDTEDADDTEDEDSENEHRE